jgi:hypothetical protein
MIKLNDLENIINLKHNFLEIIGTKKGKNFCKQFDRTIITSSHKNLFLVISKFLYWLLTDEKYGVIQCIKSETTGSSINTTLIVAKLLQHKSNGGNVTKEEWEMAKENSDTEYMVADEYSDDHIMNIEVEAWLCIYYAASVNITLAYENDISSASSHARNAITEYTSITMQDYTLIQSEKLLELLREAK